MKFNIDISAIKKKFSHLQSGLSETISKGLADAAEQGAQVARTQHEYKSHGSAGLESKTVAYKNSAFDQGIIANAKYASWVEFGNGPPGSKIYPTKSSVLHFTIDGKDIFVKWVRASKPRPFMANALNFEKNNADRIIGEHINNFLASI